MGYRNRTEQGPKLPVDVLVGVTVPKLRGVNLEQDPASIQPTQHQYLKNVRLNEDGILICRGGLAKVTTDSIEMPIRGLWDAAPEGHVDQVLNLPPPPDPLTPEAASVFSILRPTAQGNYNEWSAGPGWGYGTPAGYSKWSALAGNDSGAYIWAGPVVLGAILDSYQMENLAGSVTTIVKVLAALKLSPATGFPGPRSGDRYRLGVRLGGVDVMQADYVYLSTSGIDTIRHDFTATRPGGGAWSVADINAVEVIVQMYAGIPRHPPVAQLWLEITHS